MKPKRQLNVIHRRLKRLNRFLVASFALSYPLSIFLGVYGIVNHGVEWYIILCPILIWFLIAFLSALGFWVPIIVDAIREHDTKADFMLRLEAVMEEVEDYVNRRKKKC